MNSWETSFVESVVERSEGMESWKGNLYSPGVYSVGVVDGEGGGMASNWER